MRRCGIFASTLVVAWGCVRLMTFARQYETRFGESGHVVHPIPWVKPGFVGVRWLR
ncbi:hypothetical protein DF3PB_890003 [uncultured Defluviicoccus sp.]|uniref:Uncharacterized protein n=1 Tax=metagenome TaxID=256318 RepID=A0A380TKE4_9ZZZZ|nr:hypothetical protein DF3PB_890003 [uncultured Defluviicoccus sp.]